MFMSPTDDGQDGQDERVEPDAPIDAAATASEPGLSGGRPMRCRIFLSYNFHDEQLVQDVVRRISYYLRKQPEVEVFMWHEAGRAGEWPDQLREELSLCDAGVVFISRSIGNTQRQEAEIIDRLPLKLAAMLVPDEELPDLRSGMVDFGRWTKVTHHACAEDPAAYARSILKRLGVRWTPPDGLPDGYLFDYEKDIIEEYRSGGGKASGQLVSRGAPRGWPTARRDEADVPNPLYKTPRRANQRDGQILDGILVDAHATPASAGGEEAPPLAFREAGLAEPKNRYSDDVRAAIIVCGGIAPGINAVISGIVQRHTDYISKARPDSRPDIFGYIEGLKSLVGRGPHGRIALHSDRVRPDDRKGGSIIPTSRADALLGGDPVARDRALQSVIRVLEDDGVDILYVIGGDGGMRAAHAIWTRARAEGSGLSVVGIPKTMDNDILWVWQSFGFLSAVEKAKEAVLELHTETASNPRLCVIQLFGSDSGFVVSHAALASGVCDAILVPEMDSDISLSGLAHHLKERLRERRGRNESPHGIVIMAESFIPSDIDQYLYDPAAALTEDERRAIETYVEGGRRLVGQTPDELRRGGLKVVRSVLEREIRSMRGRNHYWDTYRVLASEPRHLIRAIPPSVADVIFAQRLGVLAVDNAMAGYTDFMISQWLTEYVLVPLDLVVLGRKRLPNGFFMKAVLENTRQPRKM